MPLPKPSLDSRRFDQLTAEGRALIPRLAPEWTDHNASDPGITLLELGAWLAEQNIFRFDRLSEAAMRAFVRLVGVEPSMPGVATTVISLVNPNANGVSLVPRIQVATPQAALFETTQALFASPAKLVSVLTGKTALTAVTAPNDASTGFAAFGTKPRTGHALYLGFDQPLDAAGETLSLYVWTPTWREDAQVVAKLQSESAANAVHCPQDADWKQHYRVRTAWEFQTAAGIWKPLVDVVDETRALSLSGFVRFTAPVNHQAAAAGQPFFIRCRIVRGRFECPPRVQHVAFNAVTCEHALSVAQQSIAACRGHASAVFAFGQSPVVSTSVTMRLDDGAGGLQTDWREAADFERAGAHDRVYVLNPERGEVHSGDGLRGAVLPAGFTMWAAYRTGGGVQGNIGPHSLTAIPANAANTALVPAIATLASALIVDQPVEAVGGSARESLSSAQARAFDRVNSVDKAVTLDDIERLALQTPGVPVARVRAIANLAAELPCYPAPGVVTLIVIPHCPRPAPMPSRALLDAVERYLHPRRLVTSEIHAIAPNYRRIGVSANLHVACETNTAELLQTATATLNRYLDPLTGGPGGTGWEFGRPVYRNEVMALLAVVPGVARVTDLQLHEGYEHIGTATGSHGCCGSGSSGAAAGGRCDNIELCAHELVRPGRHRLSVISTIATTLIGSEAHECESA